MKGHEDDENQGKTRVILVETVDFWYFDCQNVISADGQRYIVRKDERIGPGDLIEIARDGVVYDHSPAYPVWKRCGT